MKRLSLWQPSFTHPKNVRALLSLMFLTCSRSQAWCWHGGSEDQAIAALLHDAVEDQGGLPTLDKIRDHFGNVVAKIVDHCTDAYEEPKPEWRIRKEEYIASIAEKPLDAALVSCAYKLHNARAILNDLRTLGNDFWGCFTGGKEGTLWYYQSLATAFNDALNNALSKELKRTVKEMDDLAKGRTVAPEQGDS